MVDAESLRPRKIRRLMVAMARAAALFILITGIYGVAALAFPKTPVLNRSIATLIVGVIAFELLRPPRRVITVPTEPYLLTPADVSEELAESQRAVDRLRQDLDALRLQAEAAHERESQARDREAEARQREGEARDREGQARDLESQARQRELQTREQLERESESLQRAASRALEEIQRVRTANDELRAAAETEKNQKVEMERRARREVEEAKQKAEVEKAAQRKTLEAEWATKLKDVQRELDLTRSSAHKFLQSNEALKQQLEEERQRLHAELQRIVSESKSERDDMQAEARAVSARLDELLAQLDRERKLSQELSTTRARLAEENLALKKSHEAAAIRAAERERDLGQRAEDLGRSLAEANVRHQAAKTEAESLQQQIAALKGEHDASLQKIVNGLTTDHENDLGEAIAAREAARAEARSLTARIAKLEEEKAERPPIDEKTLREKIDAEWGEKLQKIVNGLTTDHENDIGDALAAREAARAEVRSMTARIAKLEDDNEQLKTQLEERAAPRSVDEKALREKIDAEWSEKLQTIVGHIASDHEADVGKAIEEREAARAEVRNLSIKMTALQQKLDAERHARELLQVRVREAEDRLQNAPTQPMQAFREPEPQPANPEQQARAEVLQFAEQASEAIRRATSPGTVPVPAAQKAHVLIVHHDPRIRTMWRDTLEKIGFDVDVAPDGLEGLRVVKAEKPDVVIADYSMPKMDGRELCNLIKSDAATADVKVILMTGVYTNEVPLDALANQHEADELLRKPVKPEAMKAALQNLLAPS